MGSSVREARPERRLTLLFIATGGSFGLFATIVGALYLASLSGMSIELDFGLFDTHPYLQIFGFLSEFVIGVAYSLLPLFKSKRRESLWLAYLSYALITLANVIILVAVLSNGQTLEFEFSQLLILGSAIIFTSETITILGRPSKLLGEAEPFIALSSVSFILISLLLLSKYIGGGEIFSPGFLYLSLLGFVGSMIYGVELRTVAFRMTKYRKEPSIIAFVLQALAVATIFAGSFVETNLLLALGSVLFLGAAALLVFSIRIFERQRIMIPLGSKVGNPSVASHNTISSYSKICTLSSSLWLLFACVLGAIWLVSLDGSFAIRDSFIHSAAIGFVGSAIITFGPVLLPGVLSSKAPSRKLSLWPLILLEASLILRVVGNFYASMLGMSLPAWESLSGILILVSMVWFMRGLHFRSR